MRASAWIVTAAVVGGVGCGSPASTPAPAATPTLSAAPVGETDLVPAGSGVASPAPDAAAPAAGVPAAAPGRDVPISTPPPTAPVPPVTSVAPAPTPERAAPPVPVYREVTVPSGTRLSVELRTALASNTSGIEDRVQGVLARALVVDGEEVVPAGARLSGVVTDARESARVKGRARLALRFTSLTVDDTQTAIGTATIAREAAGTKKEDAAKIGIGAGAGAIVGAIAGGKKGAAVGGAVGAGAGTGVVLGTRGDEVQLPVGSTVTTTLTRELVVRVRQP